MDDRFLFLGYWLLWNRMDVRFLFLRCRHLDPFRTDITSRIAFLICLRPSLLLYFFLRKGFLFIFLCLGQCFCCKHFLLFLFWNRICQNSAQISVIQHHKLMQRTGCRNIQKFHMSVICRIFFLRRIIQKNRIKLQSFRVGNRKHHNTVSKFRSPRVTVHNLHIRFQLFRQLCCLFFLTTDHRNRFISILLPLPDRVYRLF